MDITEVKKGMFVECQQGEGRVLVVDTVSRAVLVENPKTKQQYAAEVSELIVDDSYSGDK